MTSSSVVPFRLPGRFAPADRLDAAWFAQHPARHHRVRPSSSTEALQACSIHGAPSQGSSYGVAVRMIEPGLFQRRFVVICQCDGSEEACRNIFEVVALIAGIVPWAHVRHVPAGTPTVSMGARS